MQENGRKVRDLIKYYDSPKQNSSENGQPCVEISGSVCDRSRGNAMELKIIKLSKEKTVQTSSDSQCDKKRVGSDNKTEKNGSGKIKSSVINNDVKNDSKYVEDVAEPIAKNDVYNENNDVDNEKCKKALITNIFLDVPVPEYSPQELPCAKCLKMKRLEKKGRQEKLQCLEAAVIRKKLQFEMKRVDPAFIRAELHRDLVDHLLDKEPTVVENPKPMASISGEKVITNGLAMKSDDFANAFPISNPEDFPLHKTSSDLIIDNFAEDSFESEQAGSAHSNSPVSCLEINDFTQFLSMLSNETLYPYELPTSSEKSSDFIKGFNSISEETPNYQMILWDGKDNGSLEEFKNPFTEDEDKHVKKDQTIAHLPAKEDTPIKYVKINYVEEKYLDIQFDNDPDSAISNANTPILPDRIFSNLREISTCTSEPKKRESISKFGETITRCKSLLPAGWFKSKPTFDAKSISSTKTEGNNVDNHGNVNLAIQELIETEFTYVQDLEHIVTHYIPVVTGSDAPPQLIGKKYDIFGNIEEIKTAHKHFLIQLMECENDYGRIGKVFARNHCLFLNYIEFYKSKQRSRNLMSDYGVYFKKRQKEMEDRLDLGAFLLKPIQRLPRYVLILKNIAKYLKKLDIVSPELEQAISIVKLELTKSNNILEYDSINMCPVQMDFCGNFIQKDLFKVIKPKKYDGMVFLFEHVIMFTTIDQSNNFMHTYKGYLRMDEIQPIATKKLGMSTCFEIIPFDIPNKYQRGYYLDSGNLKTTEQWVRTINNMLWVQLQAAKDGGQFPT